MIDVTVLTTARALVDERWVLRLTEEQAARLREEPEYFHDLMAIDEVEVLEIVDERVYNEDDREVTEVI